MVSFTLPPLAPLPRPLVLAVQQKYQI